MTFISYYCEYFDDDSEIFWFKTFKAIVRAHFQLMNTSDLDYQAVKDICHPSTEDLYDVARICYRHNETYFREQVMTWMEIAQIGDYPQYKDAPIGSEAKYLRDTVYYVTKS